MLQTILKPRPLGVGGVLAFALGVGFVYAGFPSLGPMMMLAGILLVILAAIAWTTPEEQVVAARRALLLGRRDGEPEPVTAVSRRTARVYDLPGDENATSRP